ncbi:hypothetical protein JD276_03835 [Leucobacter sp. CSA1]|uniref:Uncharacterized protein n=1 Tax=Leucobacter chromiisoli TaxID=2796471 RepID=A0A934UUG2_9MICO|nr:hypothetical protein [Leucobacter chromiisoli]MBK0418158.1 hypothetical protein [Leucobacter chromiisoli]
MTDERSRTAAGEGGVDLDLARALFPELAARVDAAYGRNRTGRREGGDGVDGREDSLDAWLDREAAGLRRSGTAGAAFGEIADDAARSRFERAFAAARKTVARAGLRLPEPELFADAGVDLAALGASAAGDAALVPVPAPHGLGAEGWLSLFDRATGGEAGRDPVALLLATEVLRGFPVLDEVHDAGVPRVRAAGAGGAAPGRATPGEEVVWTLRLVPAGDAPPVAGLGFAHGPHVSLPEMLMLQLMRLEAGEDPVDAHTFTWLAGVLAEGRLAARHVYDAGERAVRISVRETGNQGPHLGARPPVG